MSGYFLKYLFRQFSFFFGAIWALVGTIFFVVGIASFNSEREIQQSGVRAEATLVEKIHRSGKDNSSTYLLKYVFHDAAGQEHIRESQVNWETWRQFEDGSKLPIVYLPGNPSRNRLGGELAESEWTLALVFGSLGFILGGIGWILVLRGVGKAWRAVQVLQNGVVVEGRVTSVERAPNVKINKRHPQFFRYRFKGPDGQDYQGESPYLPPRLEDKWQTGDPIPVVYDPDDPARHQPDIFGLRSEW
ncbi:MAG: DUF3592 domain-containing protein [Planctomycetes bacterium]|nr:DUF3592 domain-containing protein [Planctomycetota bacterium]